MRRDSSGGLAVTEVYSDVQQEFEQKFGAATVSDEQRQNLVDLASLYSRKMPGIEDPFKALCVAVGLIEESLSGEGLSRELDQLVGRISEFSAPASAAREDAQYIATVKSHQTEKENYALNHRQNETQVGGYAEELKSCNAHFKNADAITYEVVVEDGAGDESGYETKDGTGHETKDESGAAASGEPVVPETKTDNSIEAYSAKMAEIDARKAQLSLSLAEQQINIAAHIDSLGKLAGQCSPDGAASSRLKAEYQKQQQMVVQLQAKHVATLENLAGLEGQRSALQMFVEQYQAHVVKCQSVKAEVEAEEAKMNALHDANIGHEYPKKAVVDTLVQHMTTIKTKQRELLAESKDESPTSLRLQSIEKENQSVSETLDKVQEKVHAIQVKHEAGLQTCRQSCSAIKDSVTAEAKLLSADHARVVSDSVDGMRAQLESIDEVVDELKQKYFENTADVSAKYAYEDALAQREAIKANHVSVMHQRLAKSIERRNAIGEEVAKFDQAESALKKQLAVYKADYTDIEDAVTVATAAYEEAKNSVGEMRYVYRGVMQEFENDVALKVGAMSEQAGTSSGELERLSEGCNLESVEACAKDSELTFAFVAVTERLQAIKEEHSKLEAKIATMQRQIKGIEMLRDPGSPGEPSSFEQHAKVARILTNAREAQRQALDVLAKIGTAIANTENVLGKIAERQAELNDIEQKEAAEAINRRAASLVIEGHFGAFVDSAVKLGAKQQYAASEDHDMGDYAEVVEVLESKELDEYDFDFKDGVELGKKVELAAAVLEDLYESDDLKDIKFETGNIEFNFTDGADFSVDQTEPGRLAVVAHEIKEVESAAAGDLSKKQDSQLERMVKAVDVMICNQPLANAGARKYQRVNIEQFDDWMFECDSREGIDEAVTNASVKIKEKFEELGYSTQHIDTSKAEAQAKEVLEHAFVEPEAKAMSAASAKRMPVKPVSVCMGNRWKKRSAGARARSHSGGAELSEGSARRPSFTGGSSESGPVSPTSSRSVSPTAKRLGSEGDEDSRTALEMK